jgi:hypothetical protein
MPEYQPVPVSEASRICDEYAKSMVVILCYDAKFQMTHTTTYGVSAFDKENAAAAGALVTKAIGADLSKKQTFEDFHASYDPAVYKQALELLRDALTGKVNMIMFDQRAANILGAAGWKIK